MLSLCLHRNKMNAKDSPSLTDLERCLLPLHAPHGAVEAASVVARHHSTSTTQKTLYTLSGSYIHCLAPTYTVCELQLHLANDLFGPLHDEHMHVYMHPQEADMR